MNKVRCAGCRRYIDRTGAIHAGLSWFCDDACRAEQRLRARAAHRPARPMDLAPSQRSLVHRRDGYTCRVCGGNRGLHVHHINYRSEGGGDHETNLILLCGACHALVHTDKDRWKPLLLGVIWEQYVNGRFLTARQLERHLQVPLRSP